MVKDPDYILKDSNHNDTVLFIKTLFDKQNLSTVIKLEIPKNVRGDYKSSVITAYKMNEKRLKREIKKKKALYKK